MSAIVGSRTMITSRSGAPRTSPPVPSVRDTPTIMTTSFTPIGGLVSQTPATPNTPVNALPANLSGGYINNPPNAPGNLYVDPTGPASTTANGTTMALVPGQSFFVIPGSTLPISVASTFANHKFVSVQWT